LSAEELDFVTGQIGKTPIEVHKALSTKRARKGVPAPNLTNVRKVLKGLTYKRGGVETRGRKLKLSKANVRKMNSVRRVLQKKADGEREVTWENIRKAARAPKVCATTSLRAFRREGITVQARRPREKPQRTKEHAEERVHLCEGLRSKPATWFSEKVDLIIDNKAFDVPTNERARRYMKQQAVRFHLRTPEEGLQPEYTRPSRKKNRFNTGGTAKVCAGVSNCRVVMWEYLPKSWNGKEAAALYEGAIAKTLKKARGEKRKYLVLEDNDPTGYKSNVAMKKKVELGIETVVFPRYSPDLNPLDYCLWAEIEKRVLANSPKTPETVAAYKRRLRLTALRLPAAFVRKAVEAMPKRIKAVIDAKGQNISCD
jgi:transposase